MTSLRAPRTRSKRPQGVILYEGPSMIDGKPIVVIATALILIRFGGSRTRNQAIRWSGPISRNCKRLFSMAKSERWLCGSSTGFRASCKTV